MNVHCKSSCCESSQCVFTILPCPDDGSIVSREETQVSLTTEADIEGSLHLQDELVEELHDHEGDLEYEEEYSELVYDHDNFYSDKSGEPLFKNHKL